MKKHRLLAGVMVLCLLLGSCGEPTETTATFPTVNEDKQKDVAFTCYNYDFDVYTYSSWQPGLIFYILSKEYVAPSEISVSVPVDYPYDVHVYDALAGFDHYQLTSYEESSEGYAYAQDENQFQYQVYLYQTSRGMDWKNLGQLLFQWSKLNDQWWELEEQGLADTSDAQTLAEEVDQAYTEYRKAKNTYTDEYRILQAEDLPTFYMYMVEVYFMYDSNAENASFREIEVTMDNESHLVEIGEVRLHNECIGNSYVDDEALKIYSSGALDIATYPYGAGIEKREGFVLCADEDVTLLSCAQLEGSTCSAEILEIYLTISDNPTCNDGMDIVWDGKTPIQISNGKYVKFDFLFRDERMKQVFYGENLYPTVTYEHNGESYTLTSQLSLYRRNFEPWYWYAVCFQELDLQGYFDDYYYYAVDTWRKEYQ